MLTTIHLPKGDFGLSFDIGPHTERPADALLSASQLIRALERVDINLAQTIDLNLAPRLELQELEVGSLWAWFRTVYCSIPDEVLASGEFKRVIGHFLVKAKTALLRYQESHTTITRIGDIDDLRQEINESKDEVDRMRELPVSSPVPVAIIVIALQEISIATKPMPSGQGVGYITPTAEVQLNKNFVLTEEKVQELLTAEKKIQLAPLSLIVKKPDYLGTSMWDVIVQGKMAKARIADTKWIEGFHKRNFALYPGDALRGDVRVECFYDEDGKPFNAKYTVERVHEIENRSEENQQDWVAGDGNKGSEDPTENRDGIEA